jgi:hypothetical protein
MENINKYKKQNIGKRTHHNKSRQMKNQSQTTEEHKQK